MKEPDTEHILVSSIKLTFVRDNGTVVLSALIFVACGDLTGMQKYILFHICCFETAVEYNVS